MLRVSQVLGSINLGTSAAMRPSRVALVKFEPASTPYTGYTNRPAAPPPGAPFGDVSPTTTNFSEFRAT